MGTDYQRFKFVGDDFMASEKVLYKGHPVAAVAAVNPHVAEEAARLIKVTYEVLPSAMSVKEAMREDAPLLHDGLYTNSMGEMSHRAAAAGRR